MIDHISTYALDYVASKNFYDAVFKPLGHSIQAEFVADWEPEFPTRRICGFGSNGLAGFWVIETLVEYTPRHVAFSAKNRQQVDQFYTVALQYGGQDNGKPGLRPEYHQHYYGAFILDPDRNNVEAVCHTPPS